MGKGKKTDTIEETAMSSTIKVELDENGYFTGNWASVGGSDDWIEVEAIPEDTKERIRLRSYRYENGAWVFDGERYKLLSDEVEAARESENAAAEIEMLKGELAATDYQVIKCNECSLAGTPLPYDIAALHEERQGLRDRINGLEEKQAAQVKKEE